MESALYKEGQGTWSRYGTVILLAAIGLFCGFSWYWWAEGFVVTTAEGTTAHTVQVYGLQLGGSLLLFAGFSLLGFHLALKRPQSADYLIDMDIELRKVVWPAVQPLFDPKTEAWGSTYIVIICTVVLGFFIWVVDTVLDAALPQGLLYWLFS